MRIVAEATAAYAEAGYFTIVDGIVLPGWFFEPLRDALIERGNDVAYVVLRASLETCQSRSANRLHDPLSDANAVKQLWKAFANLGDLERHVIDTDDVSPIAVADQITQSLSQLIKRK
jgi:hypothetical protein